MNASVPNSKRSSAYDYFVLSYCLLVPFAGTIALFVILDQGADALVFGGAAGLYFSGLIVGLFNLKTIRSYGTLEFWAAIAGMVLSGVCGLLSAGACVISLTGGIDS